jgi:putative transferase (TIGR04331 family)
MIMDSSKEKVNLVISHTIRPEDESQKVVLMGEWSRLYGEDWYDESIHVLPYHWDDRTKMENDYEYLHDLKNRLIPIFSEALNTIHGTDYSDRSWHLMIGYWLTQFIAVVYDRWCMLEVAQKMYDNLVTYVYDYDFSCMVPCDTSEAGRFFIDDDWNHAFISMMIERWTDIEIIKKPRSLDDCICDNSVKKKDEYIKDDGLLYAQRWLKKTFGLLLNSFGDAEKKYVITSAGLDLLKIVQLRLRLHGAMYFNPIFPPVPHAMYDDKWRHWSLPYSESDTHFEKIVKSLIPLWMPICFVEGFSQLRNLVDSAKLPVFPSVVFTAYKHFNDDSFKYWFVSKTNHDCKLVIGLHGGSLNKFNSSFSFEADISDYYVHHGSCVEGLSHRRDVGQFFSRLTYGKWNPKGHLLVVTVAMPRYLFDIRSMAVAGQMLGYFEDQFSFYRALSPEIQAATLVRLYPEDYGWKQKQRWLDRFQRVRFDDAAVSMKEQASNSRIFISTYNATTYLESLSANIPTVIYWDNNYWEIKDSSQQDFETLKSVGIFHDSPESAAKHVVNIWDDVARWWYNEELQKVRAQFCRKYAYRHFSVISRLADVLHEAART